MKCAAISRRITIQGQPEKQSAIVYYNHQLKQPIAISRNQFFKIVGYSENKDSVWSRL